MPTPAKEALGPLEDILDAEEAPPNREILRRSNETRPVPDEEGVGSRACELGLGEANDERGERTLTEDARGSLLLPRRLAGFETLPCAVDAGGEGRSCVLCVVTGTATRGSDAPLTDERGERHGPEELGGVRGSAPDSW